ncbi:MAG: putative Fe-S clusters-containing protein containing DUF4445 domain [Candidatus Methanohalarchaeum thermophilum]|uniref:Fe-S clusters-containing protein containing DUF4445 domain n=1 Tax=Methanohalarchaeum thermophilum TaxID=1903181 RepID=A0A1Q6DVL4_METT1|nr:MAG: putative Fe-S clusters-containing protein containing DUF4445 domain [Candidatus Methanohalarchaeum thermophilum]
MNQKIKLVFEPEGKRLVLEDKVDLLEAAKEAGIDIKADCGGNGVCKKCKIKIESGKRNITEPTSKEKEIFSESELEEGYRLACMTKIAQFNSEELIITVPEESKVGEQVVLSEGIEVQVDINPPLKKLPVKTAKPSLKDDRADFERIRDNLSENYEIKISDINFSLLKQLPDKLRDENGRFGENFTATVLDKKLLDLEQGINEEVYGIAFDIGTTTVVGYLVNLVNGKIMDISSKMNPQVKHGEDVMERVTYTIEEEKGLKKLNKEIIDALNEIIQNLTNKNNIDNEKIYETTLVGNTGMHHISLGINPEFISKSPYVQAKSSSIEIKPSELGLNINEKGGIYALPTIGSWMGADTVGCLISSELYKKEEMSLMVDVGTNGELVIGNKDKILGCSMAAGPALEGAHIKHGMRAANGAIDHIEIDQNTYEPNLSIIGDTAPRGICGSGIIDAVAELYRTGIIHPSGGFNEDIESDRIREGENNKEYVLSWKEESDIETAIVLTRKDIEEIQLAKGAISAGAHILMEELNINSLGEVLLAGAFGNYIDPKSALMIGLIPDVPVEKVEMIGNAAGVGARLALINKEKRKEAEKVTKEVNYIRLAAHDKFQGEFPRAMYFPHKDKEKYPNHDELLKSFEK